MGITTTTQQEPSDDGWRRARKCGTCGFALHTPLASDGSWQRCGRCGSEWDAEEQREPAFDAEPVMPGESRDTSGDWLR